MTTEAVLRVKYASTATIAAGASTAVGSALGSTDMHSVVQLLAGQGANMAALSLQLPAGRLHRMADARNGSSNLVLSAEDEACMLTPGVRTDPSLSIAESITLRGTCGGMWLTDPCLGTARGWCAATSFVVLCFIAAAGCATNGTAM